MTSPKILAGEMGVGSDQSWVYWIDCKSDEDNDGQAIQLALQELVSMDSLTLIGMNRSELVAVD